MKRPFRKYTVFVAAALIAVAALFPVRTEAAARAPLWEVVTVTEPEAIGTEPGAPAFEIQLRDGYIYITAPAEVTVEVFTILGQPVTRRTIKPGTVRLSLGSRGIYILKGAGTTRRVNL